MTSPGPPSPWTVYGALILVQLFFGANYLAAKVLLREIEPSAWALLRVAGAAACLTAVLALARRGAAPGRGDVLRLALYSIIGVVINQLGFIEGLSRTTATHSSILMTSIPISTLAIAVLLRHERLSARRVGSIALGASGVLLVLRPAFSEMTMLTGDLLTLTNALSYSLFLVISRPVLMRVDALWATTLLMAFGTLGMLPFGAATLARTGFTEISGVTWALAAFIVICPTAGAYLLTSWALRRAASSLVALFIYLQPVIAVALAAILLGERPRPTTLVGAAVIFVAVYLALVTSSRRA